MSRKSLRIMSLYRYHLANTYYQGEKVYEGNMRTVERATYNYCGMMAAYGLSDRLSLEAETGYFINKTQVYRHSLNSLSGSGFSNLTAGLKYALYQNSEKRLEWTVSAAGKLPLSSGFASVQGVELPVDLQPSTSSYGFVCQSYFIKENSFNAWRFFLVNRYEKNFENPNGYLFGSSLHTAAFFSKHFIIGSGGFKDWTIILQARHQYQNQNRRWGKLVEASGNQVVFLSPQINCSIHEKWNLSVMLEKIIYRSYRSVQLGGNYSVGIHLSRDINLQRTKP
jgi:hypothetical protein